MLYVQLVNAPQYNQSYKRTTLLLGDYPYVQRMNYVEKYILTRGRYIQHTKLFDVTQITMKQNTSHL